MKHTPKRILALLLSLVMVLSVFPTGVLAAGEPNAATDADAVSSAQPAAAEAPVPDDPVDAEEAAPDAPDAAQIPEDAQTDAAASDRSVPADPDQSRDAPAFTVQPQDGNIYPDSGCDITWATNFTPIKVKIMLYFIEPNYGGGHLVSERPGNETSYHLSYDTAEYWLTKYALSDRYFYILAYYTEDASVSSQNFHLNLVKRSFTTKPQTGHIEIGQPYTVSWATNFTPTKIKVGAGYVLETDGWHSEIQILQELPGSSRSATISYDTVWKYGTSPYKDTSYYITAYYGDGASDCISAGFDITFTPYTVSLSQNQDSLKPGESVTYTWSTNFTAKKFELVSAYNSGWNVIVDNEVVQTFSGGTQGTKTYSFDDVLHNSSVNWSGYRVRAYYGTGEKDYVNSRLGYISVVPLKFTGQPNDGTITPGTPYVVNWAMNYDPVRYELLVYWKSKEPNAYGFYDGWCLWLMPMWAI